MDKKVDSLSSFESLNDPKSLLLIGSTGMGKSTLGNYLIDPSDDHITPGKNQTFRTSTSNNPETDKVQVARVKEESFGQVTMIDTPGLNETHEGDLRHMVSLVTALHDMKRVTACAIVIKFQERIDQPFISTIEYYSQLLPELFANNVFIVMTDFEEGERAARRREKMGLSISSYTNNIRTKIQEIAMLRYQPVVFLIDGLPLDEDAARLNEACRCSILKYVCQLRSTNTDSILVAKTPFVKQRDSELVESLDGNLSGYVDRIIESKQGAERVLKLLLEIVKEQGIKHKRLVNKQGRLNAINTEELVTAKQWTLDRPWKFGKNEEKFEIKCDYPICQVDRWDDGNLTWDTLQGHYEAGIVAGTVSGMFVRKLHASLTIKTYNKYYHAEEIELLKEAISELQEDIDQLSERREKIQSEEEIYQEQIKAIKEKIEETKLKKEKHLLDYMTVEEAKLRLEELWGCNK